VRAIATIAAALSVMTLTPVAASAARAPAVDSALQGALDGLVAMEDGPPGAYAVVNANGRVRGFSAGTARVGTTQPVGSGRRMRIASVSKAITGATALRLVQRGILGLDDTIGQRLPSLPAAWHPVTLRQLLNHTGGVPDFSASPAFARAVAAAPAAPPAPAGLLAFAADQPLEFAPGTRFRYSNSGPVIVALMVEAATGVPFPASVRALVTRSAGMPATGLAVGLRVPAPALSGYQWDGRRAVDATSVVAFGGWAWASGGFISTPSDLSRFVRRDAGGSLVSGPTRAAQMTFRPGASSPPGPGANAVGLGIFRYRTRCGTFYGHTGSILGYTQIIMATGDGRRSAVVSASTQAGGLVLAGLRRTWERAACAAAS